MGHLRLAIITTIFGALLTPLCAQTQKAQPTKPQTTNTQSHTPNSSASASPTSPVGRWVAEHPSQGGLGSWWDFRADGTLTMHTGVVVTSPVTHDKTTITMPPATTTGTPSAITYHIAGDTLRLDFPNTPGQSFTRVGTAPSTTDPLLGKWRPVQSSTPTTDQAVLAQRKAMALALYVFSADNTESVRIPFTVTEGRWNPTTHTFQLQGQTTAYSYQRTGPKQLNLGQPPDNQRTDTYLPDPLY